MDEYTMLVNKLAALEEEHREHIKVLEFLDKMEPERKAWRQIGEVLVEMNVKDAKQSVSSTMLQIETAIKKLNETLDKQREEFIKLQEQRQNQQGPQ